MGRAHRETGAPANRPRPGAAKNGEPEPNGGPQWPSTASRFLPPALPATHVGRTRLLDRLDLALRSPLTLVAAPAGWGKSVLLSAWIRTDRAAGPVAWVGFDAADGLRAWHHIVETLTRAGVHVQADGTARGRPADRDGPPAVLILDDFHLVTDRAVLANVERLLQQGGPNLRVVMLTRSEPGLPLYRWRLTGQLAELRTAQLSFTPEEATELLRRHELDVPRATVRKLLGVTEGWAAGLTLAARAMSWHSEPDRVVDELGVGDRDFLDYLDREVLHRLTDDLREMLLCTSVLEYVCPGLVEALTERPDGARVLGELEQANAFVVYCGGAHGWYRYRRLLRRAMYAELGRSAPERIPALHTAASLWYTRNGLPAEALRHALAAGDWDGATLLLVRHWRELLTGYGQASPVTSTPVPPETVATDARLALAFAVAHHDAGDVDGMRAFLRRAEESPHVDEAVAPILNAARLAEARTSWDADRTLTAAARLLGSVRGAPAAVLDEVRAMALTATADASFALGQLESAEVALREALPLARRSGSCRGYVAALRQQALVDLARGRLGSAVHACQLVLGAVSRAGFTQVTEVSWARVILGGVCLARGRLDEAAYHIDQGMAGMRQPEPGVWTNAAIVQARLHQLRGDPARGLDALAAVGIDVGIDGLPPVFGTSLALMEAELRLSLGDVRGAGRLVAAAAKSGVFAGWTAVVTARLHLANGEASAAAAAVGPCATTPEASLRTAEACLLHAHALRGLGNRVASERFVERSLQLANDEGLREPFLVNAALIRDMLVAHLAAGTSYANVITDLTGAAIDDHPTAAAVRPIGVEPLTERELIVLRHLRSMMSTTEIASMLCVSTNTVKTHVKNVYRKLGVGRRRDAIRRAQEVGLI
ncbi:MAG TPA: LuxR C-terminal-related transcriptional regulator [Planosporangium sp.]|nr:LuxR C-terminal-related transcriptional regulator [Planosporangium sp.]